MKTLLWASHLDYRLGRRHLLQGIDLRLAEGENLAVVGLNGCGKTTLLAILAGYLPCEEGAVGRDAPVALVSDSFFSRYLGKETLDAVVLGGYFDGLGIRGALDDGQIAFAWRLLSAFGLAAKGRKPFDTLSKGERQKGLIARALVSRPRVLLLDEPFSGLDVYARSCVEGLLARLLASGKTSTVLVTHRLEDIIDVFGRAVLLRDGKVHSCGRVEEVVNGANLSDFFRRRVEVFTDGAGRHLRLLDEGPFDGDLMKELVA